MGILLDWEDKRSLRSKGHGSLEEFDREKPGFSVTLNRVGTTGLLTKELCNSEREGE